VQLEITSISGKTKSFGGNKEGPCKRLSRELLEYLPEFHLVQEFRADRRRPYSRADIRKFWAGTWRKWQRKKIFHIPPHKVIMHLIRDVQLILLFAAELLRAPTESQ